MSKQKSIEPVVANFFNQEMTQHGIKYYLEQEISNESIKYALSAYASKSAGGGGNRPDANLLLSHDGKTYPVLIEYKGMEGKLLKLDTLGEVSMAHVKDYAVNGSVHYATGILQHTDFEEIIAVGANGYRGVDKELITEVKVYLVAKKNLGVPIELEKFRGSTLEFLAPKNIPAFIEAIDDVQLSTEERASLTQRKEAEIDASLVKLNNNIYKGETGLTEKARVYLVSASILVSLSADKYTPLKVEDLLSEDSSLNNDGEIFMRKIEDFLNKRNVPTLKKKTVLDALRPTITSEQLTQCDPEQGSSRLKRIFSKVVADLGIYYKIGLNTDFTGRLFNEMFNWLGYTQDKLNDVVLTPSYVSKFLVKLARVDKDSYVWDFATGSAGLLVAAMNEMLDDAKRNVVMPEELHRKEAEIRANQLLGIELLDEIYILAVLNMIIMGDGSSRILQGDSLKYDGDDFPATRLVLNPPYSKEGNGMIFVEKALSRMPTGFASVIIQGSAGTGKAANYNKRILQNNTLLASVKMPSDLFGSKASVQTYVYVFEVGKPHDKQATVKFIDFADDGYKRTNRKKASVNLRNIDRAEERYQEVVDLVAYGPKMLNILPKQAYLEGEIDPENGADWNQSAAINTKPTEADFKKTVADYLAWEVSNLMRGGAKA